MRHRISAYVLALGTSSLALALTPVARAQDAPVAEGEAAATADAPAEEETPEFREAMERFGDAQAIFDRGDFRAALAEFQRIYDLLEGHPNRYFVLFNLARSYEELHRYDRAIELYRRYLDEGGPEADGRSDVEASLRALERLLGTVQISLTGLEGTETETAEVWIGDYQVGQAPGEVHVPGGQHTLEIRATGFETVRREIEVASRQRIEIEIALAQLSDFRGLPPAVFFISTGLTIAAVAAGFGMGGWALALSDDAERCGSTLSPGCRIDPVARQREIQDVTLAADVLFGVAGLFAITSIVLIFVTDFAGAPAEAAQPTAMLVPAIGPDVVGASVLGSF